MTVILCACMAHVAIAADKSAYGRTNVAEEQSGIRKLYYSDHTIGEIKADTEQGGDTVNLNMCGRRGAVTIFGNFGHDGKPKIVVSPVYRFPELIAFFDNAEVKSELDKHITNKQSILQAIFASKKSGTENAVGSLDTKDLNLVNSVMEMMSRFMRDSLVELGKKYQLEAQGISSWDVLMKPSKIFPKGILSPSFVYETTGDFLSRLNRAEEKMFGGNPDVLIMQEVDRGGSAEGTFSGLKERHSSYVWVASVDDKVIQAEGAEFTTMIAYKSEQFTPVPELNSRTNVIKQIVDNLFFSSGNGMRKTSVVALRSKKNQKVKYVVGVHGDYNMSNKDMRIYEILRRLFDLVPGLELGADLNAVVAKESDIRRRFTEFKGTLELWPTPENGAGSNPTLDCLIRSPYGTEEDPNLDARLSALLQEAVALNAALNAPK